MKRLGLTLGGGGARGAAHIGVLAELERLDIQPDLITGCSIGGMLGALLATGLNTESIQSFFQKLSVSSIYVLPRKEPALSQNSKIEKLLEDTIGRPTFDELSIPLAVVATDLVSRQLVVIDEGDVITAVLATIALPMILPPIERDGRFLVDGGMLNNVPFDVAVARGASAVIAVDLTHSAPYGTENDAPPPPTSGVVGRVLNRTQRYKSWQMLTSVVDIVTTQSMNTRLALSKPDLLLRPYLGTIGFLDFHRWEEGIEAGKTAVREHQSDVIFLSSHSGGDRE